MYVVVYTMQIDDACVRMCHAPCTMHASVAAREWQRVILFGGLFIFILSSVGVVVADTPHTLLLIQLILYVTCCISIIVVLHTEAMTGIWCTTYCSCGYLL